MIEPEFFLPSIDLNLQEALSLLLLVHKGRTHLPMPFKNSALLAGIKVENNLPAKIRKYCSATLANISIRPDRHAPMDLLDRIFSQLQNAIRTRRKIQLSYHSLYEQADIATVLSPYHLTYNHRAWYILGHSSIHKSTRTFKLNRIKKLELLEQLFVKDKEFDIQNYLGRAWSMIPEGRMYNIELRFSKKVAKNVAEVQWHSTQKNYFNGDGSLTVSFRVDGLGEIAWWILGYGDQVEVVAPAVLRKKIATTAQLVVEKNTS
jgi:proteasome accessory factor B